MQRRAAAATSLALLWVFRSTAAQAQYAYYPDITKTQIEAYIVAALLGAGLGALASDRLAFLRPYLKWGFRIVFWLLPFLISYPVKPFITIIAVLSVFGVAYALALNYLSVAGGRSRTFGSAQWAAAKVVQERGLVGTFGLTLGYYPTREKLLPLHYAGDRHLLTVAPTRAGKGVAAIIPNLLTYAGSALVIDPKGENAMITAIRRGSGDEARKIEGLGQEVHIVDPWGIATPRLGTAPSCFNPLDWLDPDSLEIGENAMMLADAWLSRPMAATPIRSGTRRLRPCSWA